MNANDKATSQETIKHLATNKTYMIKDLSKKDLKYLRIENLVYETIKAGKGDWSDIVAAVRASDYEVKDFLKEVRGPLAGLLKAKLIYRTKNIHEEVYLLA